MEMNPLQTEPLFYVGPIPIAEAVLTTWAIMALMVLVSWLGLRPLKNAVGPLQTSAEIVVEAIDRQIQEIVGPKSQPYMPMLATLFLYLAVANLVGVIPGVNSPTAHIETPAALAGIVFLSTHYFGISVRGLGPYLRHYTQPTILLTPLNVISELTRTFSLMIRLFGNMMSHELVLAIIALLAGLLVPIPFLLLGILMGLIQAYIFTVLASVYIGAATGSVTIE